MRRDYSHIPKTGGIYAIRNKITNERYIGSTKTLRERGYRNFYQLKKGIHFSEDLQSSWNQYGKDNFIFEVLEVCEDDLFNKENYYIILFKSNCKGFGFNKDLCNRATNYQMSEKTREKIRIARAKQIITPEQYKKAQQTLLKNYPNHYREAGEKGHQKLREMRAAGLLKTNKKVFKTKEFREKMSKIVIERNKRIAKKFKCIETGEIFDNCREAAKKYNISSYKLIWRVLKGQRKHTSGYHFVYIDS